MVLDRLITQDEIETVRIGTVAEKKEYILKLQNKELPQKVQDIILKHYEQTIKHIQYMDLPTVCPFCESTLERGNYDQIRCPNGVDVPGLKTCSGYRTSKQWGWPMVLNASGGWLSRCIKEANQQGYSLKRNKISNFINKCGLETPSHKVDRLRNEYDGTRYHHKGPGRPIVESKQYESCVFRELTMTHNEAEILSEVIIFYKLKSWSEEIMAELDHLVLYEDLAIIIECKLSSGGFKKFQKETYILLAENLFRNRRIEFEYRFKRKDNVTSRLEGEK